MPKELIKKIALRYEFLFILLALFFISILLITKTDAGLAANIIATLILVAMIPIAIIIFLDRRIKKGMQ